MKNSNRLAGRRRCHVLMAIWLYAFASLQLICFCATPTGGAANLETPNFLKSGQTSPPPAGFDFIDTSFENASQLWYDFEPDGTIALHLIYDNERSSVNRASGHFHFLLHAQPGVQLTLEFKNLDNIWNGQPGSIARELKTAVTSTNGCDWKAVSLQSLPQNRVRLTITMPGPKLYVARVEPYRLSDLDQLLAMLRTNPLVKLQTIGKTVEGRDLEIIQIGSSLATNRVFLRARAHAWEAGTSWVVEGFIKRLLQDDGLARNSRDRYCAYILPMANKDGVAHGRTRFNLNGKDLNRNWDKPADPHLVPENYALEQWLEAMVRTGQSPNLALELHNDGAGLLQLSRPSGPLLAPYLDRMARLEQLLHKHTWFTEGTSNETFHNPGSLGEGWLERFGVTAAVHELNCNWIAGLNDYPSARHWEDYGAGLVAVFYDYFDATKP